jgi:hypothetical protein
MRRSEQKKRTSTKERIKRSGSGTDQREKGKQYR